MNDRIKLAEAMNIEFSKGSSRLNTELPDPFTYADEDYAVLEWARNGRAEQWKRFVYELNHAHCAEEYKIGDYARAALKELK